MLSLFSQTAAFAPGPVVSRVAAVQPQMGVADMCVLPLQQRTRRRAAPTSPAHSILLNCRRQRILPNCPLQHLCGLAPDWRVWCLRACCREGTGPETGGKVFDPWGLSKIASEETLAWYRAAELKHSRVAMAAATGWAYVASGGPLFPGYLSIEQGITFESLGREGYAAWDAVPDSGKFQIIGIVGILDLLGEAAVKPHYMMGGTPGKIPLIWDPLGFTAKLSPETLARKRTAEIKNG